MDVLIPVGPYDKPEWVSRSIKSALSQRARVIVYDNSERDDLSSLIDQLGTQGDLIHHHAKRMSKINMAKLRNQLLTLTEERIAIMLDSDVVLPDGAIDVMRKTVEDGASFTWMHYAYSEDEIGLGLKPGEENPNLGCAALDTHVIKELGMFDEIYDRDEDIWLYSKLKRSGHRVQPSPGRCLHLNKVHSRTDLKSSLKEARRNLWRSKYDMMLMLDGLTNPTFLTGYAYYGSYYMVGIVSPFLPPFALLYLPLVLYGLWYYRGPKKYALNLIPGLALAISLPAGVIRAVRAMRLAKRR